MRDFVTLRVTDSENKKRLFECQDSTSETGHRLLVTVAATHSGIVNGNMRFYRPDRMQDSAPTWCRKGRPAKPVLVRHDKDCDPLGRVLTAKYVDESYKYASALSRLKNTLFYDSKAGRMDLYKSVDYVLSNLQSNSSYAGLGYCELGLSITNPDAIRKVQDEEYLTVSVGFDTDSAICSACHTDWAVDDKCEHRLGSKVDGKHVFLITGNFDYEELSFVNLPADPFGAVTNKQAAAAIKDSIATRAYFLGMSLRDQTQLGVYLEDSLEDLGLELDITPMVEEPMQPKTLDQISAELKSDSLTKPQALELRSLLEAFQGADAKETARAKRALSTICAIICKNDWADDASTVTSEQVAERIAGIDAVLATLSPDARIAYVARVETEAAAFGLEFAPPNLDAIETEEVWNLDELTGDDRTFFNRTEDELYDDLAANLPADSGTDAKISTEARKKMKSSTFCGPNRSFPVSDCAHVTAARRLIGTAKLSDATKSRILGCVSRKAKAMGCGGKDTDITAAPLADAVTAPAADTTVRDLIQGFFDQEAAYFATHGNDAEKAEPKIDHVKVLGCLENLHKAYNETPEHHKHLIRYCTSAMLEHWAAGGQLDYYKNRIAEEGKGTDAVVSRCEYDALTESVGKYEAQVRKLTDSNKALLETSKDLTRKQRVQMATSLVLVQALTDSAYAGKTADELKQEIESKSQRTLISLSDALTDAREKLPAAIKLAASGKPSEVVKEVSDKASIKDSTERAEETPEPRGDGSLEAPMGRLMDLRERRILDSQLRYEHAKQAK
jgi:hypothetical protein